MAFNPEVQQVPGYIYGEESSRPISPIPADQSKATLIKGAGEALTGGVEIGKSFVEQSILTAEHEGLDNINDEAIKRLNAAKANPALIDQEEQKAPPSAVKGLPANLDKLDQARANNRISQTYIDMQKDSLAKQLRSQYPGWRDYIDESFARSNREDPANRYISSLVGDINSMAATAQAEKDKTANLVQIGLERGYDPGGVVANAWYAKRISNDDYRRFFSLNASHDYQRREKEQDLKLNEATAKEKASLSEHIATSKAQEMSINWLDAHRLSSGITESEAMRRLATSGPDPELAQQLAAQLQIEAAQFDAQYTKEMSTPFDNDPKNPSHRTLLGPTKWKEVHDDAVSQFRNIITDLTNEKAGATYAALNMTKAATSKTRYDMMFDPDAPQDFKSWNRIMGAFKEEYPALYDKLFQNVVGPSNYLSELDKWQKGYTARMLTQPNLNKPDTIKAGMDKLQELGNKVPPESKAKAAKDLLDNGLSAIIDPQVDREAKQKAVTAIFGPGNEGLMNSFAKENQSDVLKSMTNDKMVSEIHKAGGQAWDQYSNWVKTTFRNLTYKDIAELNQLPKGMQIGWDSENHHIVDKFTFTPAGSKATPSGFGKTAARSQEDVDAERAHQSITRINNQLDTISGLAKYDNVDVNAYMLNFLAEIDMAPNGLGEDIRKAVVNASKKPAGKDQSRLGK